MKFLLDTIPLILFFIFFKVYDIYAATLAAIVATGAGVLISWIRLKKVEPMQWMTLGALCLLGGATLLLKDETFIKYKPSAVYWLMAIAFALSQLSSKTLIQRALEGNLSLPQEAWAKLNRAWALFFTVMGGLNLWVAHQFDTSTWVNFKVFGGLGLTFIFILFQAVYLSRFDESSSKTS
jgi:intracellular septation protein